MDYLNRREVLGLALAGVAAGSSAIALAGDPAEPESDAPKNCAETTHTLSLKGEWIHESFLIKPTDEQLDDFPPEPVDARRWARGELTVLEDSADKFQGKLVFPRQGGVTLDVWGPIVAATDDAPAMVNLTGEVKAAPAGIPAKAVVGAKYKIVGWIIPPGDPSGKLVIRGSVLAVCGPEINPGFELGAKAPQPLLTAGPFVLTQK